MSDLVYPSMPWADLEKGPAFRTQQVEYETGYIVHTSLWNHPLQAFHLMYSWLSEADALAVYNFWQRHRGGFETFRFDDFTDPAPRGVTFGVGDGVTTQFKLPFDYNQNPVIYVDGQAMIEGYGASNAVYVDPRNGRVMFDTAPAPGALLTCDVDSPGYIVHFGSDQLLLVRLKYGGYELKHAAMFGRSTTGWGGVLLEQALDQSDQFPVEQVCFGGTRATFTLSDPGDAVAYSFASPAALSVQNISFYSPTPGPGFAGVVRASIYSDAPGTPGTRLTTGTLTLSALTPGWQTVTVTPYALTANTRYWIVIEPDSGAWGGGNNCPVQYTNSLSDLAAVDDPQDAILYGGYAVADRMGCNTPDSWLGVETRTAGGDWSVRDRHSHGAFALNTSGYMVFHSQQPYSFEVADANRTRVILQLAATHGMTIDRLAGVFSTSTAPADSLYYSVAVNGTVVRTGTLAAPVSTAGVPLVLTALITPVSLAATELVTITFYSPASAAGSGWTHYGCEPIGRGETGWVSGWDALNWSGVSGPAATSTDGGSTYSTFAGAHTIRCRGWWTP